MSAAAHQNPTEEVDRPEIKSEVIKSEVINETENTTETTPKKSNFPRKNAQYHGTGRLPCPELGEDWTMEQVVRQQGASAGRYDTYYHSPDGVKFRSKLKLQNFLKKNLDDFDYNTGKFIETGNEEDKTSPNTKGKRAKIKTNELKTIDRSTGVVRKSTGPYAATLKMHERRKKQRDFNKNRMPVATAKSKDLSTSAAIQRAIAIVEKDNVEKLPYNLFKQEAMSLAEHFPDMTSDFENLVLCAWKFLSVDSKKQFEQSSFFKVKTVSGSKRNADDKLKNHHERCQCSSCNIRRAEKWKKRHSAYEQRRKRCGMCSGCVAQNCGSCVACRDMKKFGGAGSKKQSCIQRRCVDIHSPNGPVTMVPRQSRVIPYPFPQPYMGCTASPSEQNFSATPWSPSNTSPLWPRPYENDISADMQPEMSSVENDVQLIRAKQAAAFTNFNTVSGDMGQMKRSYLDNDSFVHNSDLSEGRILRNSLDALHNKDYVLTENSGDFKSGNLSSGSSNNAGLDEGSEIPVIMEHSNSQKLHKRKSRVPVYIQQNCDDREVDILVE